jgi:hypothetical protein
MNKEYNSWSIEKGDYHRHGEEEKKFFIKLIKCLSKNSGVLIFSVLLVLVFYLIIEYVF